MNVRTMMGIAAALLFVWRPAFAAGDDLEAKVEAAATKMGKPDDAATKDALRLAAGYVEMTRLKINLDPALTTPTTVAETFTHGYEAEVIRPQGPFTIEEARKARQDAREKEQEARNPDVIAQRKANLKRWEEIEAHVGKKIDALVLERSRQAEENPYDLYSIDTFAKLEKFVSEFKGKQSADQRAALDEFTAEVAKQTDGQTQAALGLAGVWSSYYGDVTFNATAAADGAPVQVTGFWQQGEKKRGQIMEGTFDPRTGKLVFTYYQDWNDQHGRAEMTMSEDGQTLSGTWRQESGGGSWTMTRKGNGEK